MKTLFISDLDGTLLGSDCKLSDYTINSINSLIERGMIFSFATARSLTSARRVANGIEPKIPIISYNGAFVVDFVTSNLMKLNSVNVDDKNKVRHAFEENHLYPFVYAFVDDKERVTHFDTEKNDGTQFYLDTRKGDKRLRLVDDFDELYCGDAFYFTCIGEKTDLIEAYNTLIDNENLFITLQREIYREEYWLEIMSKNATKSNGILELKKYLGCDKVVCFGDAINDLPMFDACDYCCAVGNAVQSLKDKADEIIDDNDSNAVAKWLERNYKKYI